MARAAARPAQSRDLIAVLFGIGHIQNYLLFGKPLDDTLFQIISAAPDLWQYAVLVFLLVYGIVLTRKPA